MANENNDLIHGLGKGSMQLVSHVDLESTTKAFRLTRVTTAQKNAIANAAGLMVFDMTLGKACINTGSGWQTITSS